MMVSSCSNDNIAYKMNEMKIKYHKIGGCKLAIELDAKRAILEANEIARQI